MKNVNEFLDWLVDLDIRHYKTESFSDYTPSGNSHFYLPGSQERFTSEEIVLIWTNKASDELSERWLYAISEGVRHLKKD
jgi:hypothetical protein